MYRVYQVCQKEVKEEFFYASVNSCDSKKEVLLLLTKLRSVVVNLRWSVK